MSHRADPRRSYCTDSVYRRKRIKTAPNRAKRRGKRVIATQSAIPPTS
jgi:hypothetical protein